MAVLTRLHPHVSMPGLLTPQTQQVPFKKYLGAITNYGDLAKEKVYFTTITNIKSETHIGQQWGSDMAKQTYTLGQVDAPYYRISAMVEYNVDEQSKFEAISNGIALPDFLEKLARQGIAQRRHQGVLLGFDAAEPTQGIINNSTFVTLPADSKGGQTLLGYDLSEFQAFLSKLAREVLNASYGMAKPCVIASSTRVVNYLKSAVVPLIESQKEGGGVDSVAGLFGRISGQWLGVGQIEFIEDNLLQDYDLTDAASPKDVILMIAPGLNPQEAGSDEALEMNLVGNVNITYNTWCDEALGALRFDAPPSLGSYQFRYMYKMTPGVTLRPEAVVKTSIKYA